MVEISKKTGNPTDPLGTPIGAPRNSNSVTSSGSDPPDIAATDSDNVAGRGPPVPVHHLDGAGPMDPTSFPIQGTGNNGNKVPATIPNLRHMLNGYGITVRYNVIGKKLEVLIPGASGCPDNADNTALAQINSLATLNGIPTGQVPSYLEAIGGRNQFNPVAEWITSKPWDGQDRLPEFYRTLKVRDGSPRRCEIC